MDSKHPEPANVESTDSGVAVCLQFLFHTVGSECAEPNARMSVSDFWETIGESGGRILEGLGSLLPRPFTSS
jgi:hypothetical protein